MTGAHLPPKARARGFTLVELIVVIGIIALLSAVTLPSLVGYMQGAKIRAAEDMVAGALHKARNSAIMKNTQMGISLVFQDNTTFWVHIEDTMAGAAAGTAGDVGFSQQGIDFAAPNAVLSTRYQLPDGVQFVSVAADCPAVTGFLASRYAIRFDRYGVPSIPGKIIGNRTVPNILLNGGSVATNWISDPAPGDQSICIRDARTRLVRAILISSSGRIIRR